MASIITLSAVLLISAVSVVVAEPAVTFAVFGDWGWGPEGDRTGVSATGPTGYIADQAGQIAVGNAMGAACEAAKCKFVINTGDNFYQFGISTNTSVLDPQWNSSFNAVYSHPALQNLKFYGVLGNHDYGRSNANYNHSILPQLEYTAYDPQQRWYIPTRYWAGEAKGPEDKQLKIKIYITAVDSSPFIDDYCTNPTSKYYTPELLYGCQASQRSAMLSFAQRNLAKARAENTWSIAVGHHPLFGVTGTNEPYRTLYAPVLNASKPHMYFNGHDHQLAHLKLADVPNVDFFTSGAAGIASTADTLAAQGIKPPYYSNGFLTSSAPHGFAIVQLNTNRGHIAFYGIDDVINAPTVVRRVYYYNFNKN